MTIRTVHRLALGLLTGFALAGAADAQPYPTKPIRLVVNFPPGGAADVIARVVGPVLAESLKQPVVVENKGGANGNIGSAEVAKSPPDGHTLLVSSGGAITINPLIYAKMPLDPEKDLAPVAAAARIVVHLETHPSVPVSNVAEFIAHLKANPGKLSYGSPGQGSSPHLAGELFKRMAGVDAQHVPYKGGGPAVADLVSGQIQFMFDPGPGLKMVRENRLRLLAVGSSKRSPMFPDVPTLAETGLAGFDADTLFGIYAPAGTPPAVIELLNGEINKALALPNVGAAIRALGAHTAAMSLPDFRAHHVRERERFGGLVKDIGLKLE